MIDAYLYWCLRCGKTYDPDSEGYSANSWCPDCRHDFMKFLMKRKWLEKIADGYVPAKWKRRGRKSYYSRMANLFFSDKERFDRLIKKTTSGKKAQITKKIKLMENNGKSKNVT